VGGVSTRRGRNANNEEVAYAHALIMEN